MNGVAAAQRTIRREVELAGVGLFSGCDVRLRFAPAGPNAGVSFVRTDLAQPVRIPAHIDFAAPASRRTALARDGARVEMVEHVLAALAGLGIDNCDVMLDGPEPPGCDGSCQPFVERLLEAGLMDQAAPRRRLRIERPVCVTQGNTLLAAHPGVEGAFSVSYHLDYGATGPIGRQSLFLEVNSETFQEGLAPSRTFLLQEEADELKRQGLGARTTTNDLLIFGPDGVVGNTLRYDDECVRHKILDLVGDLRLLGCDLEGCVVAYRSGHQLNAALVRELLKTHAIGQPDVQVAARRKADERDDRPDLRLLGQRENRPSVGP